MTLIPELEAELTDAIGRTVAARASGQRRRWRLPVLAPVVAVLGGTAVALAATGVIRFGASEGIRFGGAAVSATSGYGTVAAGGSHLLALRVHNASSPLPWGLRVSRTSRGLGCVTAGLVLAGHLGALGSDGDFHDDGLFHPIPAGYMPGPTGCAKLDGKGRLFISVTEADVPTSGSILHRCPGAGGAAATAASELCGGSETREVLYGLLGPDAQTITYTEGATTHAVVPQGPEGAYLIILPSPPRDLNGVSTGLLPTGPPITRITYRDGEVCSFSGQDPHPHPCKVPPGYVVPGTPRLAASQLRTPITANVTRNARAGWSITVTFTARVAITNAASQFNVSLRQPGRPLTVGYAATSADMRDGQKAAVTFSNLKRGGRYTGIVTFSGSRTPGSPSLSRRPGAPSVAGTLVGRFSVRIP